MSEKKEEKKEFEVPTKNYNALFCGNAGVGKSTLCSTLIGMRGGEGGFKSGAFGETSTVKTQTITIEEQGVDVTDTPGLSNQKTQQKAAEAILEALKKPSKGKDNTAHTKIFFVVNVTGGGDFDSASELAAHLILRSVREDNPPIYHLVLNQIEPTLMERLLGDTNDKFKTAFLKKLETTFLGIRSIIFIPRDGEIAGKDNQVLTGKKTIKACGTGTLEVFKQSEDWMTICNSLEAASYKCDDVKPLELNRWDRLVTSHTLLDKYLCSGTTGQRVTLLKRNKEEHDKLVRKEKIENEVEEMTERMKKIRILKTIRDDL